MKYLIILSIISFNIYSNISTEIISFRNSDPTTALINGLLLTYNHISNDNIRVGDNVFKSDKLGDYIYDYNSIYNEYSNELSNSINYYNNKDYSNAAKALEKIYNNGTKNNEVLYHYARAMYRMDRDESYYIYSQFISNIDNEKPKYILVIKCDSKYKPSNSVRNEVMEIQSKILNRYGSNIIINHIYSEAYWKMATLYLDQGMYIAAVYEMIRSLSSMEYRKDVYEQVYGYLVESFYELGKYNLALLFIDLTYKINRNNTYVKYYEEKIRRTQQAGGAEK